MAIACATREGARKRLKQRPQRCSPVWAERTTRNPCPHCHATRSRVCIERLTRRGLFSQIGSGAASICLLRQKRLGRRPSPETTVVSNAGPPAPANWRDRPLA